MVNIRFELGYQRIESSMCYLAVEMVFNRYEGQANERCVFTEHSSTSGMGAAKSNVDEWIKIYERTKSAIWGRVCQSTLAPTLAQGQMVDNSTSRPTTSGSKRRLLTLSCPTSNSNQQARS